MFIRTLALFALLAGFPAPTQRTAPPPAPPVPAGLHEPPSRTFDFQPTSAGDCRMLEGRLTLYPNGTGVWETTTLTYQTHHGDYWHVELDGVSAGGSHIFHAGPFSGPRMDDGNPPPRYPWSSRFQFDATVLNDISRINIHSNC